MFTTIDNSDITETLSLMLAVFYILIIGTSLPTDSEFLEYFGDVAAVTVIQRTWSIIKYKWI